VAPGKALAAEPADHAEPSRAGAGPRGVAEDEMTFGIVGPLTGASKELGVQMKTGIETAFSVVNDAGGVNGRRLRLVAYDDGYEPTRTLAAMKQLFTKDRVFGLVGNVGTPTAAVALPYALDHKMLFFGAFTGASLLRRDPPDRYVFNVRASYAEETAAVARYLLKVRRFKPEQIAVFAQEDAFGDAGYAGVTKALRALHEDMAAIPRVGYKRNTVDVTDAVAHLRAKGLRAVIMVASYRAAAQFIQRVKDSHPGLVFTNVSFVGSTALAEELKLLGPEVGTGVIVTQVVPPVESHSTAILNYKAALAKYFPGTAVDYVSLEGYVTASVLVEALRRAGREVDGERVVDELEKMSSLDLGLGTPISFGTNEHQGSHKVWGTRLDNQGHYETIDLD
jgi:ABC-type branched-subunit amino acid transport system substrate-binding protein